MQIHIFSALLCVCHIQKENIQLMDLNGKQLCPEQQQSNLANENRFPETNPRRGSPRRDKMGQDRDQA